MRLGQHFYSGDEVKKERHPGQVDADFAPAKLVIEHGRKDSDTCRRVKNSRNS